MRSSIGGRRSLSLFFWLAIAPTAINAFPLMLSEPLSPQQLPLSSELLLPPTQQPPQSTQFDPLAGMPGVQYVERLGENCTGFSLEPDGDLFGDVLSCYIRCSELQQCRGYVMTLDGIRCTLKGYDCVISNDAQSVFYEKSDAIHGVSTTAAVVTLPAMQTLAPIAACGSVPVVENAFVTGSSKSYNENKPGDVVMFSCLPGYEVSGNNKLTCLGTGKWDHPAPVCRLLPNTAKFLATAEAYRKLGSYIEHRDTDCEGGELTGWIRDRQTCEAACNEDITCYGYIIDVKNSSCVLKTSSCELVDKVLTRATFIKVAAALMIGNSAKKMAVVPESGLLSKMATAFTLPTTSTEATTPPPTTTTTQSTTTTTTQPTPPTMAGECSPAPEIGNGIIYLASTWGLRRPGDWVSYNCIQHYALVGSFLISCLPDGSWEHPPQCIYNATSTSSTTTTTTSTTTTTTTSTTTPLPTTSTISLSEHNHPRFVITNLQCSNADTLTTPFLERSACEEYCMRIAQCDGYTVSVLRTSRGQVEGTDCIPRRRCSSGFVSSSARERTHNFYKKITLQNHRPAVINRSEGFGPFPTIAPAPQNPVEVTTTTAPVTTPAQPFPTLPSALQPSAPVFVAPPGFNVTQPGNELNPAAKVDSCVEVPKITNGFVYLASSFQSRRPGDWVTFECDQGYMMTGKFIVKCLDDGTWEPVPSCIKDGTGMVPGRQVPIALTTPPEESENDLGREFNDELAELTELTAFAEERGSNNPADSQFKVSTFCMSELSRFRRAEGDANTGVFVVPCVLAINFPLTEVGINAKKQLAKITPRSTVTQRDVIREMANLQSTAEPQPKTFENLTPSTLRPLLMKAVGERIGQTETKFINKDGKIAPNKEKTDRYSRRRDGDIVASDAKKTKAQEKKTTTTPTINVTVTPSKDISAEDEANSTKTEETTTKFEGNVLNAFEDIGRNCRGDVITNGEYGDVQECARNCLAMGEMCNGFTALTDRALKESQKPFKCMLKGKSCQILDELSDWTFYKKYKDVVVKSIPVASAAENSQESEAAAPSDNGVDSLFEVMAIDPFAVDSFDDAANDDTKQGDSTACIKVLEEISTRSKHQCEGHCLRRRAVCVAYSFLEGNCKLIGSLECLENGEQIFKKSDGSKMFDKLNGNCKGGEIISEHYDVPMPACATRCQRDQSCKGFTYVNTESKCVLKSTPCTNPELYNYDVIFYQHRARA